MEGGWRADVATITQTVAERGCEGVQSHATTRAVCTMCLYTARQAIRQHLRRNSGKQQLWWQGVYWQRGKIKWKNIPPGSLSGSSARESPLGRKTFGSHLLCFKRCWTMEWLVPVGRVIMTSRGSDRETSRLMAWKPKPRHSETHRAINCTVPGISRESEIWRN